MGRRFVVPLVLVALALVVDVVLGQEYCPPYRDEPGDAMIQEYLAREARRLDGRFLADVKSLADWEKLRPQLKEQYFHMLGLWPLPEKTPLNATVTGTLDGEGYVVEKMHYQSRPRLYVTGNLYRPAKIAAGQRLPAIFYPCGHSNQGRAGNKTAYQAHGIWFARHGYVCLVVDSLQLGEIGAIHHGTYRENRWWWHSRGYTPAGVECWNGVRGIDYLQNRPDVDPERIAVTGISGGGAATFWIAAADERVKVAVPVSGMADLESYVTNRVINGHCDCMFLYNTFQWPWTQIAALVAPRAMLFTNSDHDAIFPMDANDRISNRLERLYSLYGKSDFVDAFVSIGGHAYRQDIRQGAYRYLNTYLKNDPRVVEDSEVDIVAGEGQDKRYPIPLEKLLVFPTNEDLPKDELNTKIDEHFVPIANIEPPAAGQFDTRKSALQTELRRVTFSYFPERIPPALLKQELAADDFRMETEPGIVIPLRFATMFKPADKPARVVLVVRGSEAKEPYFEFVQRTHAVGDVTYLVSPRGIDETRWTQKNPPNYFPRSHVLLGRTVDTCRIWDVIAAARFLHAKYAGQLPVYVAGTGAAGILAAYAAFWEPDVAGVIVSQPPLTHQGLDAPQLLNVLRVCDVPDVLGLLAPRSLAIDGTPANAREKIVAYYKAASASDKLLIQP
jgi:dienelactone hydrolase